MSTVTVTASTDIASLPAKVRRDIRTAHTAIIGLEPTAAKVAKAATAVGVLRFTHGLSVRGTVAVLAVHAKAEGLKPASKGTVERLGYVADALAAITAEYSAEGRLSIVADLYRIAQTGTAADVKAAGELIAKATSEDDAVLAANAAKDAANAAEHKALTTPAVRAPQIGAQGAPQAPQGDDAADDDDDAPRTGTNGTAPLMGFTTARLITELGRRVETGTLTPAEFEQFEQLAAYVAEFEASREAIEAGE